jgi:hypothetical protein
VDLTQFDRESFADTLKSNSRNLHRNSKLISRSPQGTLYTRDDTALEVQTNTYQSTPFRTNIRPAGGLQPDSSQKQSLEVDGLRIPGTHLDVVI